LAISSTQNGKVADLRSEAEYLEARKLLAAGKTDAEVARMLTIPRRTIYDWRTTPAGRRDRLLAMDNVAEVHSQDCPIYGRRTLDRGNYSYLLGLYLGDGCLSPQRATNWKLRIAQDARYSGLIAECVRTIEIVLESDRVHVQNWGTWVEIHATWRHWFCLFPQHASGRKHTRSIVLADWQKEVISSESASLVRGLIHSDGTRHINEVSHMTKAGPRRYRYVRYQFKNVSTDIQRIFTDALDHLAIAWTRAGPTTVSVARREDVRKLDEFVGPKR
jgi:hypothetical protein